MDERRTDADKISIRCPGCGQRFNVDLDLKERMVECGTCEHRFRVNDEVVVRQKRFYPGERRGKALDTFSRIPKNAGMATNFQTAHYADDPVHEPVRSASPLRLMFGFVAVAAVVVVSLLLAFGGKPGGVLDGAAMEKRLMLAGFTAVIATVLLVAANPGARIRAVAGAVFSAALLISLPFFFTEGNKPAAAEGGSLVVLPGTAEPETPAGTDDLAELKKEIQYEPLAKELARYQGAPDSGKNAAGIWLREVKEYHKLQIKDYIVRTTGADPSSHMYPRPEAYLMVVSGVTEDLAELARLCERFGEVRRIINDIRVIEVVVNNASFEEGELGKLTDLANPAFYELNRRELESIDLERARNAIIRLAEAEPKLYRPDIIARMQQLLKEGDVAMQDQIGRALLVWGEPGDGTELAVRTALAKLPVKAGVVPESLVKVLAARKDPESIPLVDALWAADHNKWEELYGSFGPAIEDPVLAHFAVAQVSMKRSATRLLGRVGTAKSIPVLEGARAGADSELVVFIDRAVAAIRSRS